MSIAKLMIAAPKSGSGKTLVTCALLEALKLRGLKVQAYKCGPDFIDPMFHRRVLGLPSKNLDLFFTSEEVTRDIFCGGRDADISVIEGVMGLYDGLGGISEEASTYHLAQTLQAPIVLVVNAHGMGRSLIAEIKGFLGMDRDGLIRGVILNQTSEGFYKQIAPLVEEECGCRVYGYFPTCKDLVLESRHLGLKLPGEIEDLRDKLVRAAGLLEAGVDVDGLVDLARRSQDCFEEVGGQSIAPARRSQDCFEDDGSQSGDPTRRTQNCFGEDGGQDCFEEDGRQSIAPKRGAGEAKAAEDSEPGARMKIGVAYDEAFCFYYEDNLRLLKEEGAELVFFSPLHDECLPDGISGLLLGGGYPELVLDKLEANSSMRQSIKEAIDAGLPTIAECGGFMYLHTSIRDREGRAYRMVDALEGECHDTGKLVRFGYAEFNIEELGLIARGHEFHYYDSDNNGQAAVATKPVGGRSWTCMHVSENRLWGYPHLYYPSNPALVTWFAERCKKYGKLI